MRGSAVASEAVHRGRLVVAPFGTGFATDVAFYGLGAIARDIADFPRQISMMARTPRVELQRIAVQGRDRLLAEQRRAFDDWIEGENRTLQAAA